MVVRALLLPMSTTLDQSALAELHEGRLSEYRCPSCGYGARARMAPARCPMCSGTVWDFVTPVDAAATTLAGAAAAAPELED